MQSDRDHAAADGALSLAGTHFDADGRRPYGRCFSQARNERVAVAQRPGPDARGDPRCVLPGAAKGDVIAVAELAGIMAAKQTGTLIPLCHPIGLDSVSVRIVADVDLPGLVVTGEARCTGRTGRRNGSDDRRVGWRA